MLRLITVQGIADLLQFRLRFLSLLPIVDCRQHKEVNDGRNAERQGDEKHSQAEREAATGRVCGHLGSITAGARKGLSFRAALLRLPAVGDNAAVVFDCPATFFTEN